jgi:hypothetical protein
MTTPEPSPPDTPEWPGLELAYEFVRPSYDVVLRRAEVAEARARATLGFASPLMIAAPAFVAAVFGPGNRSFASPWFILGILAFAGVLICVIVQQLPQVVGEVLVITPSRLVADEWLRASPIEFKRNLLIHAADNWDDNQAHIARLAWCAIGAAACLVIQAASLAIWALRG